MNTAAKTAAAVHPPRKSFAATAPYRRRNRMQALLPASVADP